MNERLNLKTLFDSEMLHLLEAPDTSTQTCLISGEALEDSHITLFCGHKFNYHPIYEEIVQQKCRRNTLEVIVLGKNNVKCPYCKNVQAKLLPYIPLEGITRISGVNGPESSCMHLYKCPYIMKSGKRKGESCNKGCNTKFCKTHIPRDPPLVNSIISNKVSCACKTSKGLKCKRNGTIEIEKENMHSLLKNKNNNKNLHVCKQHHNVYSTLLQKQPNDSTCDENINASIKMLFGM